MEYENSLVFGCSGDVGDNPCVILRENGETVVQPCFIAIGRSGFTQDIELETKTKRKGIVQTMSFSGARKR